MNLNLSTAIIVLMKLRSFSNHYIIHILKNYEEAILVNKVKVDHNQIIDPKVTRHLLLLAHRLITSTVDQPYISSVPAVLAQRYFLRAAFTARISLTLLVVHQLPELLAFSYETDYNKIVQDQKLRIVLKMNLSTRDSHLLQPTYQEDRMKCIKNPSILARMITYYSGTIESLVMKEMTLDWNRKHPVILFLAGHQNPKKKKKKSNLVHVNLYNQRFTSVDLLWSTYVTHPKPAVLTTRL
ncbi:uncharacterized protein EV154DRAFT_483770 [Mucor mucedo]|uniref:uncharacterized protein n=1 Tax=Mucor mucedo TaxID=29922 RepID=UPI002220184A|nr:uncharacterized protein EV154DRAFT_483770 [Mucor mucedo]KAI7888822.1 hypothetical protein EV154DRAFT_483770 [Mucor mucedo]